VRDCDGVGRVNAVLSAFPNSLGSPRVIGLYDGDQRNQVYNWPHAYLPGTEAPEAVLRTGLGDGQRLAINLGTSLESVQFALQQVNGLDHHDWMIELARFLGTSVENLVAALMEAWLATNEGAAASQEAIVALRNAINPPG